MKKLLFLFVLFSQNSIAQITISNAYFPAPKDSLRINIANSATAKFVKISPAGTNQVWDYSFLRSANPTAPNTIEQYSTPDTGTLSAFPTADIVRNLTNIGQKEVYNKTSTRFELIGYQGFTLGLFDLPIKPVFNTPVLERRAPMSYNSTNNNASSFSVPLLVDWIPESVFSSLPVKPDSMRLRFQTTRQDKTDAWGQIRIPGGNYDVLRERRFEVTERKVEARIAGLLWIDVTALLLSGNRPPKDTTVSYYFWSNTAKEPIAMVQFRNEQDTVPSRVEFKFLNINTALKENEKPSILASLFPNPTNDIIFLEIKSSKSMTYNIALLNTVGQTLLIKKEKLQSGDVLPLYLNTFKTGIYILNMYTDEGTLLYSEKIIKE